MLTVQSQNRYMNSQTCTNDYTQAKAVWCTKQYSSSKVLTEDQPKFFNLLHKNPSPYKKTAL